MNINLTQGRTQRQSKGNEKITVAIVALFTIGFLSLISYNVIMHGI
jgi:hypothetical protein